MSTHRTPRRGPRRASKLTDSSTSAASPSIGALPELPPKPADWGSMDSSSSAQSHYSVHPPPPAPYEEDFDENEGVELTDIYLHGSSSAQNTPHYAPRRMSDVEHPDDKKHQVTGKRRRSKLEQRELESFDGTDEATLMAQEEEQKKKPHPAYLTILIIVANFLLFAEEMRRNNWAFESMTVNPMLGPSTQVLLTLGAKYTPLVLAGETWRLITSVFLHAGVFHVVMNMFVMYRISSSLEQTYGWWRILVIFTWTGIVGNLASSIFLPDIITVGASGAIYGLVGSSWGDFILNTHWMKNSGCFALNLCFSTFIGLGVGLFPLLDNFTHVFGFLTGVALSLWLYFPLYPDVETGEEVKRPVLKYGSAVVAVVLTLTLVIVFYARVDAHEVCDWCEYISCVDTPWWDCDTYGKPMICETNSDGVETCEVYEP